MNWPFMATFKAILIDIDISASNCRYWTDILVDTRLWCMIQVHASTRNSSSTKPIMTIENEPIHRGSKQSKSRQFKFEDLQHKTQLGRSKVQAWTVSQTLCVYKSIQNHQTYDKHAIPQFSSKDNNCIYKSNQNNQTYMKYMTNLNYYTNPQFSWKDKTITL